MSESLAHFAVGAAGTTLLSAVVAPRLRRKHTLVVLGGIWALIPDFHHVSPVYQDVLGRIGPSRWADLFWFHGVMDAADPNNSRLVTAAAIGILLGASVLGDAWTLAWPHLKRRLVDAYRRIDNRSRP